MAAFKGSDFLVYATIDGVEKLVGCARSDSLAINHEMIVTTNKCSAEVEPEMLPLAVSFGQGYGTELDTNSENFAEIKLDTTTPLWERDEQGPQGLGFLKLVDTVDDVYVGTANGSWVDAEPLGAGTQTSMAMWFRSSDVPGSGETKTLIRSGDGRVEWSFGDDVSLLDGEWHHVYVAWNGTTVSVQFDSVPASSGPAADFLNAGRLSIGADSADGVTAVNRMAVDVHDLKVWSGFPEASVLAEHATNQWPASPSEPVIVGFNTSYFQPDQSDARLSGPRLDVEVAPASTSYAWWKCEDNLAESIGPENYSTLVRGGAGTTAFVNSQGRDCTQFDDGASYLETVGTGAGRYEWEALSAASGARHWNIGLHYELLELPGAGLKSWLWWTGDATKHIGVYVDENGDVIYVRDNGTTSVTQTIASGTSINEWHTIWIRYQHNNLSGQQHWFDSVEGANFPSQVTVPATSGDYPIYIGRGAPGGVEAISKLRVRRFRVVSNNTASNLDTDADRIIMTTEYQAGITFMQGGSPVAMGQPLRRFDDSIEFKVPPLSPGTYQITYNNGSDAVSAGYDVTVGDKKLQTTAIDITNWNASTLSTNFYAAHQKIATGNNGNVRELITLPGDGTLNIGCQGDNAVDGVRGTNKEGHPVLGYDRVGALIMTKKYFGHGTFDTWISAFPELGPTLALWTFHYEEQYEGDRWFDECAADGLTLLGDAENGYRYERNHEIDIESPTDEKTPIGVAWTRSRFNTWQDPYNNFEDNFTTHGIDLGDGQVHKQTFDWFDNKVDFYIDDILVQTNTTYIPDIPGRFWIGLWFPAWAGGAAPFDKRSVTVERFRYTPRASATQRIRNETYPLTSISAARINPATR